MKLWSRRSRLKFPLLHCIVHVSLEGTEKLHNLFTSVVTKNATFEETDAGQDEDPWEYDIAPKKCLVPHAVRGVYASLQELSYQRTILKSDA